MSDFGDYEPDDSYCAEGAPDAEQLGHIVHEFRVGLEELSGRTLPHWWELDTDEQNYLIQIGVDLATVVQIYGTNVEFMAEHIHERRRARYTELRPWDELSTEAQRVAIDIMLLLAQRLVLEGTVRPT